MKPIRQPRYTDLFRYPHGYTNSNATNVSVTIAREKERLKSMSNVVPIRKSNAS